MKDQYLLGAYADFLLDQGCAPEVVTLLRRETRADGLLLRLRMAEQALHMCASKDHTAELAARFAAGRERGHPRACARRKRDSPSRCFMIRKTALTLAQANWEIQKEPWDARILLEAALAVGSQDAARPVIAWLHTNHVEYIYLQQLAAQFPEQKYLMHIILAMVFLLLSAPAWAHKPSDSYLSLEVKDSQVEGQWDIALRDLDFAIGLDTDGDGAITWGEVRSKHDEIAAYALSRLTIISGETGCPKQASRHVIDNHTDGAYAVLLLTRTFRSISTPFRQRIDCCTIWTPNTKGCSVSLMGKKPRPPSSAKNRRVNSSRSGTFRYGGRRNNMCMKASGISGWATTMCCSCSHYCCVPFAERGGPVGADPGHSCQRYGKSSQS